MKKFLLLLLIPLCLLCGCTPAAENPLAAAEGDVRILFINVGRADAALLMTGEKNYLIDTGTEDSAEKLLAVLSLLQVDSLDGVFLSHIHKDTPVAWRLFPPNSPSPCSITRISQRSPKKA